ncbi:MAG TPA: ABC transporter ATP-binding protein [Gemmatimonas aurantiaca]|uniref:ABC transporter ATP-binding protein n=2 Tax=Gemmatimonas aurantiaca TaxID=173480 RepID=A0A3D4VCL8_9BACT|nr:ABC-F family ATP-binding cassette domain-containing protein [Gemmatimonas aurantiaca]BAH37091.1 putative ABC transporter ATP-binding protein [Gemmatimonas aurantiaca T-27]HCT58876.1 ABC transporter ATP-binding protein [Gemmatimonas aurantiaca]
MTLISIGNAGVDFGASEIFRDISFTVAAGDRWAVVGRNGTGKSSLIRLITGDLTPTRGSLARMPGLRVALMDQHRRFPEDQSLWDIVADAFGDLRALERSLAEQAANLEHDHSESSMERYGRDLERFERDGGYQMAAKVDSVLMGVGFDPDAARQTRIGTLSGGERGRVALARQLATPSDLLLLDEPTNHLDLETTAWLEQHLAASDRTVICISHDRAFLAAIADHVLHFEGGSAFPYTGSYQSFVQQREERRLTQLRQFDKQQKVIAAESDYIARNIAGQNTAQAKGRRKRLERMPRLSAPIGADGVMALRLSAGNRSGDRVIEAQHVTVGVPTPDGPRTLVKDVSVVMERNEVVALVGPNGAGKSTLIKTLLGEHEPLDGEVKTGPSTTVAYYRQDLAHLPLDLTIYEAIATQRPLWERRMVQGHLGRFGYSGDEVQRTIGTLSGGERARVAMALLTLSTNNLLILDEPTNHLDVESIEVLEDAVEEYEGSVLIVSHDRAVLRGLATQVWELRDQELKVFPGTFVEWEELRAERRMREDKEARAESQRESERAAKQRDRERDEQKAREKSGNGSSASNGASTTLSPSDLRREQRAAQKALHDTELLVSVLETKIEDLSGQLDNATLYDTPAGIQKAAQLGKELDEARESLEQAMHDWGVAAERVQKSGAV